MSIHTVIYIYIYPPFLQNSEPSVQLCIPIFFNLALATGLYSNSQWSIHFLTQHSDDSPDTLAVRPGGWDRCRQTYRMDSYLIFQNQQIKGLLIVCKVIILLPELRLVLMYSCTCVLLYLFWLNRPHWADSVIELPFPSVCVSGPLGAVFFRPLIGPGNTWSASGLLLLLPPPPKKWFYWTYPNSSPPLIFFGPPSKKNSCVVKKKKSLIRKKPTLSTDADSRTTC